MVNEDHRKMFLLFLRFFQYLAMSNKKDKLWDLNVPLGNISLYFVQIWPNVLIHKSADAES